MKYARQCSITGEGMNDGYVVGDGEMHIKYEKDLITLIRSWGADKNNELSDEFILDESWQHEEYYWTAWEDESEYHYEEVNGKLIEIEN